MPRALPLNSELACPEQEDMHAWAHTLITLVTQSLGSWPGAVFACGDLSCQGGKTQKKAMPPSPSPNAGQCSKMHRSAHDHVTLSPCVPHALKVHSCAQILCLCTNVLQHNLRETDEHSCALQVLRSGSMAMIRQALSSGVIWAVRDVTGLLEYLITEEADGSKERPVDSEHNDTPPAAGLTTLLEIGGA